MKIKNLENYECEDTEKGSKISGREGMCKHAQAVYKNCYRNNSEKVRFETLDEGKLGKRISKAKKSGRTNNIKKEKPEKTGRVVVARQNNEQKYLSQSSIGLPDEKTVSSVNRELKEVYREKLI